MTCSAERVDWLSAADRKTRIRTLNDQLRKTGVGGRMVMTAGVAALPPHDIAAILLAISTFDAFDKDNDPWGEHDCALLHVGERQLFWKIDCYDRNLANLSPDATDPAVTIRVMTVMPPVVSSCRSTFIDTPGKSSGDQASVAVSIFASYMRRSLPSQSLRPVSGRGGAHATPDRK